MTIVDKLGINKMSFGGQIPIQDLVFVMTRQCNAFCDICCNEDSPSKKGVMDTAFAHQWIEEFAELVPGCRTASFTGGEVFLCYPEMMDIHEQLFEYGFRTSIITNGYWGQHQGLAREQLKQLKKLGLTKIIVSMDDSHAVWIPPEHAAMAAKLALEADLEVTVTSHYMRPGKTPKHYFEPEWHPFLTWDEHDYLQPAGRARTLPRLVQTYTPSNRELYCPRAELVIQPNGDVEPCGSVCLEDGVYVVGNVYKQSMQEVLVNLLSDVYLRMIIHDGFQGMEAIVKQYHPQWKLPLPEHSVCYMCNSLRSRTDFWMVKDALKQYSQAMLLENLPIS
jgi:MoaA/NifB/PqqE/SkfB family radical SAM enzyme